MNDETADRLITALNNLEEDVERLSTAIEHWEVVNTARDPPLDTADSEGVQTAAEAMGVGSDADDGPDLLEALREHYAAHDVPVELDEVDGKIYVAPQDYVGGDKFSRLFGGNDRMNYDSDAPKGKQNWIDRKDVQGYIRETS